jgi:hypothetical protein
MSLNERYDWRGHETTRSDNEIQGVLRFHTFDPFGNRLEFQQA